MSFFTPSHIIARVFARAPKTTRGKIARRGVAAVEFAIVAPLFLLILFGIIEFGRMMMVQQVLTNASRVGARRAVIEGTDTTEVESLVTNYLTNGSVSGANVNVSPTNLSNLGLGDNVTVTISVPFDTVSWTPTTMFLGGATLKASTMMEAERAQ